MADLGEAPRSVPYPLNHSCSPKERGSLAPRAPQAKELCQPALLPPPRRRDTVNVNEAETHPRATPPPHLGEELVHEPRVLDSDLHIVGIVILVLLLKGRARPVRGLGDLPRASTPTPGFPAHRRNPSRPTPWVQKAISPVPRFPLPTPSSHHANAAPLGSQACDSGSHSHSEQ